MSLVVSQIVYSSFPQIGYRVFANPEIPEPVQSTFVDKVVHEHWDVYEPPPKGYKLGFLHQINAEQTLFGWLFNDGIDDYGRPHTPYCLGYYYSHLLDADAVQLVLTCLQLGPVTLISRQAIPQQPAQVEITDCYEPAMHGVRLTDTQQDQVRQSVAQQQFLQHIFTTTEGVPDVDISSPVPTIADQTVDQLSRKRDDVPLNVNSVDPIVEPLTLGLIQSGVTPSPERNFSVAVKSLTGQSVLERQKQKKSEDLASQIVSLLDETL